MRLIKAMFCAAALAATAQAATLPSDDPATAACIRRAAEGFSVPELPLWIILDVERGTVGRVSGNTNGSYDIGPMQINSTWLPRLAKLGVSEHQVLNDLCTNIFVGAWVFAHEYKRFDGDVGRAIAHYHSPTARHQQRYLGLIQGAITRRMRAMARAGLASEDADVMPGAGLGEGQRRLTDPSGPDAGLTRRPVMELHRAVFW